jgi:hypothetical protein
MTQRVPEYSPDSVYRIEARDKRTFRRLAVMPYQNIQCEFLLNEPGNLRFDVARNDPKAIMQNILPGRHEMWLYREDSLIFSGPLWDVTGTSDENVLHLKCNGILSYLNYRFVDFDRLFATTSSGGEIGQFIIAASQAKGGGDLGITYGSYVTTAMGYKVKALANERKSVLDFIRELADNEVTGFDFEITPQGVWHAATKFGKTLRVPLEYGVNVAKYSMPIFGSTIRNSIAVHGPGEGASHILGTASDTTSINTFGLMEGAFDFQSANNTTQANQRAAFLLAEKKAPLATPALTVQGKENSFIGVFSVGDTVPVRIDNGYDQYNKNTRITGYQLTVGANDQESINVYIDAGEGLSGI